MLFHDVAREGCYDLWIGDEAWEVDYFLHENPELKSAPYAWLTDFVGYLPLPEGGEREAFLTADYNAEMIEQVERYPRVRDRAIFVGDPARHRRRRASGPACRRSGRGSSGASSSRATSPASTRPRLPSASALRRELGWGEDEQICLVAVGGSGVGSHLLAARAGGGAGGAPARAGPAHGGRVRPAHRSRGAAPPMASSCTATSTASTAGSTPATSAWCKAG